ncbi:MAG TPA: metalloregulator ArsR/SmtB family transcription factor [Acidobacteriota bacterium]
MPRSRRSDELCELPGADPQRVAALRRALPRTEVLGRLGETFRALGDPTRAGILFCLLGREQCVCDLAEALSASESLVSHHLRLLRALRLVRARRDGKRVFYGLDDQHIARLFQQGLDHVLEQERA